MAPTAEAGTARRRLTGFEAELRPALRTARTVRIETSATPGAPVHRATIWVVVDETGRVLVRSWRGARGRWYRELLAHPRGTLLVGSRHIRVRAEPAGDQDRVEACSRGLREKYAGSRQSLASMLVPEVLPTTLELLPA
jgi:hypothetical protein